MSPSYPKVDLPVGTHLQVEAMGTIPVAVDNVHFAIPVEVSEGNTSAMLEGVVHPWGGEGRGGRSLRGSVPCTPHRHLPQAQRESDPGLLGTDGGWSHCIPGLWGQEVGRGSDCREDYRHSQAAFVQ